MLRETSGVTYARRHSVVPWTSEMVYIDNTLEPFKGVGETQRHRSRRFTLLVL